MPNAMFQKSDGPLQGAELSNPHYRDGHVQLKRWGAQHFDFIERIVPGNKSRWQQPDSISCLNERQLKMHVVDFSSNHGGEAGALHPIDVRDFSAPVRCNKARACSSALERSEFRRGGFTVRSSNSAPNAASSLCSCRVIAEGVRNRRSAARAMDPAWANSTRARKSSCKGTS